MFHVHTFDGVRYDVTLEGLKERRRISMPHKNSKSRKTITNEKNEEQNISSNEQDPYSYAKKAYRESVEIKSERERIFHAYEIMSSPVITIDKDLTVEEGWNFFKEKELHHMPVLSEKGDVIGIVSDGDLLKKIIIDNKIIQSSSKKTIEEIMTREVITSSAMTDIRRVAKAMFENHIGTMPILNEDGKLSGIITRSDILYALINHEPLKLWA